MLRSIWRSTTGMHKGREAVALPRYLLREAFHFRTAASVFLT